MVKPLFSFLITVSTSSIIAQGDFVVASVNHSPLNIFVSLWLSLMEGKVRL